MANWEDWTSVKKGQETSQCQSKSFLELRTIRGYAPQSRWYQGRILTRIQLLNLLCWAGLFMDVNLWRKVARKSSFSSRVDRSNLRNSAHWMSLESQIEKLEKTSGSMRIFFNSLRRHQRGSMKQNCRGKQTMLRFQATRACQQPNLTARWGN